jgi:hypothetical protein
MGDADELLAFNDMILVPEGDHAIPVLKPDYARGLEADAARLSSSSKKRRLPASIPRFGMNLRLRPTRLLCGIMIPQASADRQKLPQGWGGPAKEIGRVLPQFPIRRCGAGFG